MIKSYIIRLKGNYISEKYSKECVAQAAKYNINVEYFDAINGNDYLNHIKKLNIQPRYKFKKGRAGVFGCFLSHYYLWKMCSEGDLPFLILEHDGYFIRELPSNILDTFDDVLKLDRQDPFSKRYNDAIEAEKNIPLYVEKYVNGRPKFLEKNQTGNYMKGAYSYIIKPAAAKKIINWIAKNGFVTADNQIGDAIVDIKTTVPTVARLHPDYQNRISELSLTTNPNLL